LLNAGRRDLNSRTPSFYLLADSQLNNFSFAPKLTLPFELGGQQHRLVAGVDVHYDTLDYRTATMDYMDPFTNMPTWTVDADLKRWSLGGYLQQEIALSKKVSLILGGRIERCGFKSDIVYVQTPTNRSNESLVYSRAAFDASLIYRPATGYKFYARAASIYRYPFLEEMASYTGYAPPSLNSSLRPEKGFHYEIGAAARPYRDLDIDVALYQINMKDEIAWDGSQNSNLDQARRRGLDAGITWKRQDVGLLSASYSLVDAEFTSGANKHCTVPLVPAQMLSLRGELELPADFTLLGGVKIVGKQRLGGDVDNSIPKMDDYTVVNVGLRYQPHQIKGLQLLFTIDNLFNQNYANMAFEGFPAWNIPDAYYPAAGRTWRFAASYKF
jgi:iron complex outermembrane receptor protein